MIESTLELLRSPSFQENLIADAITSVVEFVIILVIVNRLIGILQSRRDEKQWRPARSAMFHVFSGQVNRLEALIAHLYVAFEDESDTDNFPNQSVCREIQSQVTLIRANLAIYTPAFTAQAMSKMGTLLRSLGFVEWRTSDISDWIRAPAQQREKMSERINLVFLLGDLVRLLKERQSICIQLYNDHQVGSKPKLELAESRLRRATELANSMLDSLPSKLQLPPEEAQVARKYVESALDYAL